MPARKEEILDAHHECVVFHTLRDPLSVTLNHENKAEIECAVTQLVEDPTNPRGNIQNTDATETFGCDMVVMAIGSSVKSLHEEGLHTDAYKRILVDEHQATSLKNVYAGGDAVTGSLTVIHALKTGKIAAASILKQLSNKN